MRMGRRTGKETRRGEAGTALVESAITTVVFFLLVLAVLETGRFLNTQQVLTNAAREGARLAVAPTAGTNALPGTADVQTRVGQFLSSARISGATISVTPVTVLTGSVTSQFTKVTVQLPYAPLSSVPWFSDFEVTLTGQSLMRNETSP